MKRETTHNNEVAQFGLGRPKKTENNTKKTPLKSSKYKRTIPLYIRLTESENERIRDTYKNDPDCRSISEFIGKSCLKVIDSIEEEKNVNSLFEEMINILKSQQKKITNSIAQVQSSNGSHLSDLKIQNEELITRLNHLGLLLIENAKAMGGLKDLNQNQFAQIENMIKNK